MFLYILLYNNIPTRITHCRFTVSGIAARRGLNASGLGGWCCFRGLERLMSYKYSNLVSKYIFYNIKLWLREKLIKFKKLPAPVYFILLWRWLQPSWNVFFFKPILTFIKHLNTCKINALYYEHNYMGIHI